MRSLKYQVALYRSEAGYSVCCPRLPGCWSQGETEAEAIANIQAAIQEYLAASDLGICQGEDEGFDRLSPFA